MRLPSLWRIFHPRRYCPWCKGHHLTQAAITRCMKVMQAEWVAKKGEK